MTLGSWILNVNRRNPEHDVDECLELREELERVKLENLELKRQLLDARADLETRGCLENARVEESLRFSNGCVRRTLGLGTSDLLDPLRQSPKASKANVSTPSLFQVTKLVSSSPGRSLTSARKSAVTFVEPAPADRSSSEPQAPPPKKKMSKMDERISKLEKKKMRLSMKLENAYVEFGFDSGQVKKLNNQIKQTQTQVAKLKMKRLTARFSR